MTTILRNARQSRRPKRCPLCRRSIRSVSKLITVFLFTFNQTNSDSNLLKTLEVQEEMLCKTFEIERDIISSDDNVY